jgi:hypothetical protein
LLYDRLVERPSVTDVVLDVLARLFNTCLGAGIGLFGFGRKPRLMMDLFDIDRPTALAILTGTGAAIGLLFGKKIWTAIDRKFAGGWVPPRR